MRPVVSLEQWRQRDSLVKQAAAAGWQVNPGDLGDLADPIAFYLAEPLQSQFAAISMFRFSDLVDLATNGTDRFGSPQDIWESAGRLTDHLLSEGPAVDPLDLRVMMLANFINFSTTQTARLVAESTEPYRHTGVIVYRTPEASDGMNLTVRPIAALNSTPALEPGEVAMMVAQAMAQDYRNHREYFQGVDIEAVFERLAAQYPTMFP